MRLILLFNIGHVYVITIVQWQVAHACVPFYQLLQNISVYSYFKDDMYVTYDSNYDRGLVDKLFATMPISCRPHTQAFLKLRGPLLSLLSTEGIKIKITVTLSL